jgi:hypothetical protein
MVMKNIIIIGFSFLLGLALSGGCEKKEPAQPASGGAKTAAPKDTRIMLCAKCGEIKGSAKCCKAGVEKCPLCGLNKDSASCCKKIDFRWGDVELCPKCGEVKDSRRCCVMAAEKCPKCGLHKNSPGCCRIPKAD